MIQKVSAEVAQLDISRWLDSIRIRPSKREKDGVKEIIDNLVDAVEYGEASVNEDGVLTLHLCTPLDNEKDIVFKSRIQVGELQKRRQAVKETHAEQILATVAALADKSIGEIRLLDSKDYAIASWVAVFFL